MLSSVMVGDSLRLVCEVDAWPAPSLGIFRDRNLTIPVDQSDHRVKVEAFTNRDSPGDYKLVLDITDVSSSEGGQYYCHATNSVGNTTAVMGVTVLTPVVLHRETLECCQSRNVSDNCLDICYTQGLDYPRLVARPECLEEYDSLLSCGAGGQDHSECCQKAGVGRYCLDWCRGEVKHTDSAQLCAISFAKQIIR